MTGPHEAAPNGRRDLDTTVPPETDAEQTRPLPALTRGVLLAHRLRRWTRTGHNLRLAVQGLGLVAVLTLVAAVLLLREQNTADAPAGQAGADVAASTVVTVAATTATSTPTRAQADPTAVAPQAVSPQQLAALPVALVGTSPGQAIADPAPWAKPGTTVLHPIRNTVVYAEPGGPPVAVLPAYQLLAPTWVPVVARRPGWALVLLPTRPHADGAAAAGWIHLQPQVQLVDADHRVEIDTVTAQVAVLAELAHTEPTSAVAQAALDAGTAAPGRRSFVAIGNRTPHTHWLLRLVWPFAVDRGRLCSGPLGGVSVPGLPARSGLGATDGTGCVTTPQAVRDALAEVPAGTVVLLR